MFWSSGAENNFGHWNRRPYDYSLTALTAWGSWDTNPARVKAVNIIYASSFCSWPIQSLKFITRRIIWYQIEIFIGSTLSFFQLWINFSSSLDILCRTKGTAEFGSTRPWVMFGLWFVVSTNFIECFKLRRNQVEVGPCTVPFAITRLNFGFALVLALTTLKWSVFFKLYYQ